MVVLKAVDTLASALEKGTWFTVYVGNTHFVFNYVYLLTVVSSLKLLVEHPSEAATENGMLNLQQSEARLNSKEAVHSCGYVPVHYFLGLPISRAESWKLILLFNTPLEGNAGIYAATASPSDCPPSRR